MKPFVPTKVACDSWFRGTRFLAIGKGENERSVLRAVVFFCGTLTVFYAVLFHPMVVRAVYEPYVDFNATISAKIISMLGDDARADGTRIWSDRYSLKVRRGCDAAEPVGLFIAAILAMPASWKARACGAVLGTGFLFVMNLIRIVSLYFVGVYWPRAFEVVHVDVWQPGFIAITLLVWITWLQWAMLRKDAPARGCH